MTVREATPISVLSIVPLFSRKNPAIRSGMFITAISVPIFQSVT